MDTLDTQPPKETAPLKSYIVVYAEDIPHYGTTEIEATDDADALRLAQALDTSCLCHEPAWDSPVCKRIVSIEDTGGADIGRDLPLDHYFLRNGGPADRDLCDAASDLLRVVQCMEQRLSALTPDTLRHHGLDALFETARSAHAKATPN